MTLNPPPRRADSKRDHLDTWQASGRIPVPTRDGGFMDLLLVNVFETTSLNGLPLDLFIEARATTRAPMRRFGVLFADSPPQDKYPVPLLWIRQGMGHWME